MKKLICVIALISLSNCNFGGIIQAKDSSSSLGPVDSLGEKCYGDWNCGALEKCYIGQFKVTGICVDK